MGALEGDSEKEVIARLREMHYTPVTVTRAVAAKAKVSTAGANIATVHPRPIQVSDMMLFCINLSSMSSAGIPLLGSLKIISGQLSNLYLRDVVRRVGVLVSEGLSLSDSLEKFPKVFSKFFVNMVRVGEISGTMNNVLKTLAIHMEKQEELRQKVTGALVYPVILVSAGTIVVFIVIIMVIPQFVAIFSKAGVSLPLPTKMLYAFSLWMKQYWFGALFGIGGIFVLVKRWLGTSAGKKVWQTYILKAPLFGPLTRELLVARFCRTLGSMLTSGVPLLQSLAIVKEVIDNCVFAGIVQDVYDSSEKGEGVHRALARHPEFPEDVVYMISIGEEAGQMGSMLAKSADFYENKVEYAIKGLLVYIEPLFISVLGIVVGGILASVMLPMFDMIKTIRR